MKHIINITKTGGLLLTLVCLISFGLQAQISPGDLAEPHAHLEGLSNCTLCHTLGDKVSDEKCLDCHKELKERIDQKKGYHSSSDMNGKSCVECHNDHHGRKFQIIRFDQKAFDHRLTGYKLEGAHLEKACEDCHQQKFMSGQKIKEKKYTFLGLNTECTSCHEDYHQASLPKKCLECHNYEKFKPAPKFDHNKAGFKLLGKHQDVDCLKCHKKEQKNGKDFQVFKGVDAKNCTSCHTDVHQNKFGQDCRKCHSEESFHLIKNTTDFDHNQTGFKLEGSHVAVSCKACHKNNYTDRIRHQLCTDCHKDYHEGQFQNKTPKPDCKDCHTVNGFPGSTFTLEQHETTAFPLKGAHLATPCFVCHKKTEKWNFRNIGSTCNDCHENIHKETISAKYIPENNCMNCHDESRWNKVVFDHRQTGFQLEGKHGLVSCRECHFKADESGTVHQQFAGLGQQCTPCHTDQHQQQFDIAGSTDCKRCHAFENWKTIHFDHNKTRFPLDGKHAQVPCASCHKETTKNNQPFILYKINDYRCEACHL